MAVSKIQYQNKTAIQNDEDIPRPNKVTDEDMNEIKNVVNNNANELQELQNKEVNNSTDIEQLKRNTLELQTNVNNIQQEQATQNQKILNNSNNLDLVADQLGETEQGFLQYKLENNQRVTYAEQNIIDLQGRERLNKENIETLQQEVQELEQDIKANAIIEETEKSKSLYIEDANASRGKVNVFGNMEQEIREGYNLLDISEINSTWTQWKTENFKYKKYQLKPNTSYTISQLKNRPTTGTVSETSYLYITSGEEVAETLSYSINGALVGAPRTVTSDSNGYIIVYAAVNDVTFTNDLGLMLVEGTEEKEYEAYGASPSLDYPSAIKSLGSNINLYPGWEKNTISSETGEPEIDPNYIRSVDFISVLPNKNYTIKAYNIEEFGDLNTAVRMYDINKNYLSSKWIGSIISNSLTFTLTNADVRYVKIVSSNNSAVTDTAKVDIKLEEGEVATTYSPFGQGSTEIRHFNTNFLNTENINKTISGVNIESNTDKSLKITGTAAADGYGSIYNKITLPFVLKQGTKVYLNFGKDKQLQKDTNITPFVWLYSSDNTNTANINKSGSYSATLSKDTTMLTFGIENIENAKVYNENMYIVLSTENVSEYIENKDDSYILNIQQEMLTGDYFDLETKEEVHCNGKAILNGTEAWTKSGTASTDDFAMFYTNRGNIVSSGEVKSNALKYVKDYQTQDTYVTSVGEAINIRIATEIIGGNTVELFKTFLQNRYNEGKAIEVYYKRSTPARIPLTADQIEVLEKLNKLRFHEGTNNILTTEDIALLQAKYSQNLKVTNTKMQQQIDEIKELLSTTQTSAILLDNLEKDLIEEVK